MVRSSRQRYPQLGDAEWLRRRYIEQGASLLTIRAEVGCTEAAVRQALARHDIPIRPGVRRRTLADLTVEQALSLVREHGFGGAAGALGVDRATLTAMLGNLGVAREAREVAAARPRVRGRGLWVGWDREDLADLYRRHTLREIGAMKGCSPDTVRTALVAHGIPTRPTSARPPDRPLLQNPKLLARPGEAECLNPPCRHRVKQRGLCGRCWRRHEQGKLPGVEPLPIGEARRHGKPCCDYPGGCVKVARRHGRCPEHRLPRPPRQQRNPTGLLSANDTRKVSAAAETVEAARRALPYTKPEYRDILRARVERPDASLADLARVLGISKDAYAAKLRRALIEHRQVA